jgi:methylenetetrahydrofolate dehydrogenase (NADP+)/methenyltetrahydrofolate cyclohydrolase
VISILDFYNIDVRGLNITIIGRSHLVGYPLSVLLMLRNATVTICHK